MSIASIYQSRQEPASIITLEAMFLCIMALMLSQSLDDVVARVIKARGGIERIKHEQTQRLTGKISLPSGSGPLLVEMKRPGMMREEVTLNGKSQIRTTDGLSGWGVGTLREAPIPQEVDAQELHNLAGSADFEGPLVDYKEKGNRIELAGKEKVGKRKAFKLVISMKSGENRIDFIDCKTYQELKWQGRVSDSVFESYFRDYRRVKGLMFAFEIDSGPLGQPLNQKIIFDKVDVNPPLDDARFGKP
jgi:hypothetical protein